METTRHWISDLDVQILAAAYGYSVVLPSTLNSAHVTLDSLTGTLLVQGGVSSAGLGLDDRIVIDAVGTDIRVRVNNSSNVTYATERVAAALVSQIIVSVVGDTVSPSVTGINVPVNMVNWVVSSNQDAVDNGSPTDGFVDLDSVVPGNQVTVRAAVQNANGTLGGGIYIPRGRYRLTLQGTAGDTQGDLDIMRSLNIYGTGAGETIIDAIQVNDRIFEVTDQSQAGRYVTLTVDSMTLTGGRAPYNAQNPFESHGGAIFVRDNSRLNIANSALVDNWTIHPQALGGAIYFSQYGGHSITDSVITANQSAYYTGGVYLGGSPSGAGVTVSHTIIANNSDAFPLQGADDVSTQSPDRPFTSGGYNRIGGGYAPGFSSLNEDVVLSAGVTISYIVTALSDNWDSSNDSSVPLVLSLREAINKANITVGAQEVWVPAWHVPMTQSGTSLTENGDFEISSQMTIHGMGPGLTIVDAGRLAVDDRVFDVTGTGLLDLSHVTLAFGQAPQTPNIRDGGAIRVQNDGELDLSFSAIVGNATGRSGNGGGIYFAATGHGSISNSVITVNTADDTTGGVYLGRAIGVPGGPVTVTSTIIMNNSESGGSTADVGAGVNRQFTSGGYNRLGNAAPGFAHNVNNDYINPAGTTVHYIVTSVADRYSGSTDPTNISTRDAINQTNASAVPQEIWLPAWHFVLTQQRITAGTAAELNVWEGDLEIKQSLTLRGIDGPSNTPATRVSWITSAMADKVFELVGDYDGDGLVETGDDRQLWLSQSLAADGNDNGAIDSGDDALIAQYAGKSLVLQGIA